MNGDDRSDDDQKHEQAMYEEKHEN